MAIIDGVNIPYLLHLEGWPDSVVGLAYLSTVSLHLTSRRKKQVKILFLHKAADTHLPESRQTLGPNTSQKHFPMNILLCQKWLWSWVFKILHSKRKKVNSSKQDCNFSYFLISSIRSSKHLWNDQNQNSSIILQYSHHTKVELPTSPTGQLAPRQR